MKDDQNTATGYVIENGKGKIRVGIKRGETIANIIKGGRIANSANG